MALLGDISLEVRNGISTKPSEEGALPILRISAVRPMSLNLSDVRYLPSDSLGAGTYHLKPDDLLFTRYNGNRDLVGACAKVPRKTGEVVYPDKLIRVRIATSVALPSYVERAVNASDARRYLDQKLKTSAGQIGVSGADLKALPLPLPPLPEQHRIADKLDTVLARVDAVNARLARVAPLLKRFRQSVLAAATSGRLTEDWRGGTPGDAVEMPAGWVGSALKERARLDMGFAFKSAEFADSGIRLLRGDNIEPGGLRWRGAKRLPDALVDVSRHISLDVGDVVLAMDRPLVSTGLKIARVEQSDLPCLLVQRVCKFSPTDMLCSDFLYVCLRAPGFVSHLMSVQNGSGVPHVSGAQILAYPIALPPLPEQTEIVRRVELIFGFADRLQARLQAAQTASSRLTPSLLAKAFRGELVPQDPNDEPASELLKRLAQSQPVAAKKGRGAARGPKAAV